MNHIQAFKKLEKIEEENDVWSYKIDNIYVWPLIKFDLFRMLTNRPCKKDMIIILVINKLKNSNLINLTKSYFDLKKKVNAEEIAFSLADARRFYNHEFYDSLFDPLAAHNLKLIIYEWNFPITHHKKNYTNKKQLRFLDYLSFKVNILSRIYSFFRKYTIDLKQDVITKSELNKLITKYIIQYQFYVKEYNQLFKRNKYLKRVYFKNNYTLRHQALIAAARSNKIKTIELQHGIISRYHPSYIYKRIPNKKLVTWPFADELYVFGKATKDILIEESKLYKENEIKIYNYLSNLKKLYSHLSQRETFKRIGIKSDHFKMKKILVSSQWLKKEELREFIFKLLRNQLIQEEYIIIYKTHPLEKNQVVFYKDLMKYNNFYLVSNNDISIYELYNISDVHTSSFSTCVYESLCWGVSNILIKSEDSKNVKDLENKMGIFFTRSPGEYIKTLSKISNINNKSDIRKLSKYYYN